LFTGQSAESAVLVASLRDVIRTQAQEIEALQRKMNESSTGGNEVRKTRSYLSEFPTLILWHLANRIAVTNSKFDRSASKF
jgi:hypothetical protein